MHTRVTGSRSLILKVTLTVTADFSLNTRMHFRVTRGYKSRQEIHTRVTGGHKKRLGLPSRRQHFDLCFLYRNKFDVSALSSRLKLDTGIAVIPLIADKFRIVLLFSLPDLDDRRFVVLLGKRLASEK